MKRSGVLCHQSWELHLRRALRRNRLHPRGRLLRLRGQNHHHHHHESHRHRILLRRHRGPLPIRRELG